MKNSCLYTKKCYHLSNYSNIFLRHYENFDFYYLTNLKNMKKFSTKILLSFLVLWLFLCPHFSTNADDLDVDWLAITQKLTTWEVEHTNRRINFLWSNPGQFWKNYHKAHGDLSFRERIFWWILEIDDVMNYMVFVVRFLGQLWILIWMFFIMFAWYKYMLSVFNWWKTPASTLKNAIIWVIIVIFSYAIMKILTSIIWLT